MALRAARLNKDKQSLFSIPPLYLYFIPQQSVPSQSGLPLDFSIFSGNLVHVKFLNRLCSASSHNTLAAMPDDTVRVLRCLVKGATIPMKVSLSVDDDVDDLKAMVHQRGQNRILRGTDIQDLFVWKVRTTLRVDVATHNLAAQ